jgi:hypothetical protein
MKICMPFNKIRNFFQPLFYGNPRQMWPEKGFLCFNGSQATSLSPAVSHCCLCLKSQASCPAPRCHLLYTTESSAPARNTVFSRAVQRVVLDKIAPPCRIISGLTVPRHHPPRVNIVMSASIDTPYSTRISSQIGDPQAQKRPGPDPPTPWLQGRTPSRSEGGRVPPPWPKTKFHFPKSPILRLQG